MSVDAESSKDHMSMIGPYTLLLFKAYIGMVNLRPGEAIREKQRIVSWEG
jgi:hypothetical protein